MKFKKGDRVKQIENLHGENPLATVVGYNTIGNVKHIRDGDIKKSVKTCGEDNLILVKKFESKLQKIKEEITGEKNNE